MQFLRLQILKSQKLIAVARETAFPRHHLSTYLLTQRTPLYGVDDSALRDPKLREISKNRALQFPTLIPPNFFFFLQLAIIFCSLHKHINMIYREHLIIIEKEKSYNFNTNQLDCARTKERPS